MTETIHFILTGGTIDSYYEASKDTCIPNRVAARTSDRGVNDGREKAGCQS